MKLKKEHFLPADINTIFALGPSNKVKGLQLCAEYKLSDADMKGKGLHVGVIFANCMLFCMQVFYP